MIYSSKLLQKQQQEEPLRTQERQYQAKKPVMETVGKRDEWSGAGQSRSHGKGAIVSDSFVNNSLQEKGS
ncbi:hypothetical protein ILYODFUR_002678 [Ilyodon furcidens]|uniref:Uncharacterized protein n=1 Tax=Ilyodon furcidens TaxID=33524 RepID=A0ABV0UCT8_9TELE